MDKTCRECGSVKGIEEFYRHDMMADGHLNICKDCVKARVKEHRLNNIDRIRAYDRSRNSPERLAKQREYKKKHRDKRAIISAEWAKRNKEKRRAHTYVSRAIASGKLVRPMTCELCGAVGGTEGHHDDYSKPLIVKWLCDSCHKQEHRRIRDKIRKATDLKNSPF